MDSQLVWAQDNKKTINQIRLAGVPSPLEGAWTVKEVGYDVVALDGSAGVTTIRISSIVSVRIKSDGPGRLEPPSMANGIPSVLPPEVIEIASTEQFDAEIAKPRPDAVVIADFHAEWCLPCRKLGPELVKIALAHPGKFFVLRVDFDQHPKLVDRFQVETLPLLVKFKDGKETARQIGIEKDREKFAGWLGIK